MRIRTLSAALAVALLPLTACEPPDGGEASSPEATEVSQPELPPEPDYGARTMACDTVEALLAIDDEATRLDEGQPIQISLVDGELVTDPERAVVGLGEPLQWTSENLSWVIAFQGGLSPLAGTAVQAAEKPAPIRGAPGTTYPEDDAALVPQDSARCGYYYYSVAAYDTATGDVHVSDPPIWVR